MEQPHGVESVGATGRPGVNGPDGGLVVRPGVADGDSRLASQRLDELHHPLHLRGDGHIPDGALRRSLVLVKQLRVSCTQQVLRHSTLVLCGEEGPLQVDAQQLGPVRRGLHGRLGLADAPQGLLRGVGEDGAQPAGGAVAGKEPGDLPEVLGGGSVHVHPVSPVSVQVQKAWHQHPAAQVFDPQAGGVQLADSGDPAVLHQQVRLLKTAVHIDAAAGKEQFFSHGVPLRRAGLPRWHWYRWRRPGGSGAG